MTAGKKKRIVLRRYKPPIPVENINLQKSPTTELVQVCHRLGIKNANRGTPRTVLVESILNAKEIEVPHPIDRLRKRLVTWTSRNWGVLQLQLGINSPAEIFHKSDYWVTQTYVMNRDHFME